MFRTHGGSTLCLASLYASLLRMLVWALTLRMVMLWVELLIICMMWALRSLPGGYMEMRGFYCDRGGGIYY